MNSGGLSGGASFVGERGFLGGSVGHLESKYGIPGPEDARIDLKQTRYDISSELDKPVAGFERLKVRMGYNDYKHDEIERTGEIATRFKNPGIGKSCRALA